VAEYILGPSRSGSVLLDIGGPIGAAVVMAPDSSNGAEVEIARDGQPWHGTHTVIRARRVGSGTLHAGVFESLEAGRYRVRIRGGGAAETHFEVRGGQVTYAELGAC
jgi:hypothetical protein